MSADRTVSDAAELEPHMMHGRQILTPHRRWQFGRLRDWPTTACSQLACISGRATQILHPSLSMGNQTEETG